MRNDLHCDTLARSLRRRPLVFQSGVATPIKIGILREMVERLGRAVEAASYIMTTLVSR